MSQSRKIVELRAVKASLLRQVITESQFAYNKLNEARQAGNDDVAAEAKELRDRLAQVIMALTEVKPTVENIRKNEEGYPGQAFFHKQNPRIRKAETR